MNNPRNYAGAFPAVVDELAARSAPKVSTPNDVDKQARFEALLAGIKTLRIELAEAIEVHSSVDLPDDTVACTLLSLAQTYARRALEKKLVEPENVQKVFDSYARTVLLEVP